MSGVRTPRDLSELAEWMPAVHRLLRNILRTLERHYGDMQDTEFTIEEGRLYMLQTRAAKRPAQAAVRFAVDAVGAGLPPPPRRSRRSTRHARRPPPPHLRPRSAVYDDRARRRSIPGAAKGTIVFTAKDAVTAAEAGRATILMRPVTEADDVAGFHAAKGILTSEDGKASHAALVARGMGRPAVTGAAAVEIDLHAGVAMIGDVLLHAGDLIGIDGTTGAVTLDDVPLVSPRVDERFEVVLRWCDDIRTLGFAPTPTLPTTRVELARSAPRGSAYAAPSTFSRRAPAEDAAH